MGGTPAEKGNDGLAAPESSDNADVIVAGGGLAGCLLALRLADKGLSVLIVEAGVEICGNHTWSFHKTDIDPEEYRRLSPLIVHEWAGQKVIFPRYSRRFSTPYASMTSERLRSAVRAADGIAVRESSPINKLEEHRAVLDDGSALTAPCIVDCRGFSASAGLSLGFQKFVGIEVELAEPHSEDVPTIMDASVSQLDGYRFLYVLPMSPTRLLIEDTRYSDTGSLDEATVRNDALEYAAQRGWTVDRVVRTENGILPITLAHDAERFWGGLPQQTAPIGLRAALFHPTTGYSLPMAVATAKLIAELDRSLTTASIRMAIEAYAHNIFQDQSFYRLLNRMLFVAAEPSKRFLVLQRFYSLRQPLIERFYAGKAGWFDKARILTGKPPVPIQRAIGCVSEEKALLKLRTSTHGQ